MAVNSTVKIGIVGLIGAVLCAMGATIYIIFPKLLKDKVYENVRLINGSMLYNAWEEIPIPIFTQIYVFNITNANELLENNTAKPVLQQLGPYTYRQHRKKYDISFDEQNDTVSYKLLKWYIFDPNMTKGSLDDSVTTLNIPHTALATVSEKRSAFEKMIINNLLRKYQSTVFITRTVDELLFKGYTDHLMEYVAEKTKRELLPDGKFGLYKGRNYTDNKKDSVYVVNAANKLDSHFLEIVSWNYSSSLPFWNDTYCNMINGSDGSSFRAFLNKDDRIYLYAPELCRSIYAEYEKDVDVHGVHAYRFSTSESVIPETTKYKCFCVDKDNCYSAGILDLSACNEGAPLAISGAHFFRGDPMYSNAVEGLNPNKHEHESYIDIEPTTGSTLRVTQKLQVNVRLRPLSHLKLYRNVPKVLLPIVWVNESADVGPDKAEMIKSKLIRPLLIANAVIYALMVIGSFIVVIATIVLIRIIVRRKKNNKQQNTTVVKVRLTDKHQLYPQFPQSEADETLLKNGTTTA